MIRPFKGFVTVSCLLMAFTGDAQRLKGSYLRSEQVNELTEAYLFPKNGNVVVWFRAFQDDLTAASGGYRMRNDSIEFNFRASVPQLEMQIFDSVPRGDSKASFEVRAMYSDGRPFKGLRMVLKQSNLSAATDNAGILQAELGEPPSTDGVSFEVDSLHTAPMTIGVKGLHRTYAFVVERNVKYRRDTKVVLALRRSWRKITLTDKSMSLTYKKVKEKKVTKAFATVSASKNLTLLPSAR